jgi:4-amino-4-deoxy-L-arabinose transferase-like glycosyltransferase
LTPTLYGEPFLTKPPGAYAAIGLSSLPFGRVTEETARLPSAIAATFTVLFAFATLRRTLGDNRAFAAALLLPVSLLWLDKAPSAEIDMLQVAWVAAALFSFWRAIEKGKRPTATSWSIAALLCVAGGFLTKWTAPAFFYIAVVPFLWQRGQMRWLFSRDHLIALTIAVLVCGEWAALVAREVGWRVLWDTVYQEATQRFAPSSHGKPYPWVESLKFPAIVLGASLPWSIPALFALRPRFLRSLGDGERRLVQLLHCWAWPNLIFWSLPSQHHVRYVLPICPAITVLGVIVIGHWVRIVANEPRQFVYARAALLSALLVWSVTKIVFVESILPARTADRNVRETGKELTALVPEGEILYLCRLKDEGILFYYGRPALRLANVHDAADSRYVLVTDDEWKTSPVRERSVHLATLHDQQQAAIHLIRVCKRGEDVPRWQPPDPPTRPTSLRSPP